MQRALWAGTLSWCRIHPLLFQKSCLFFQFVLWAWLVPQRNTGNWQFGLRYSFNHDYTHDIKENISIAFSFDCSFMFFLFSAMWESSSAWIVSLFLDHTENQFLQQWLIFFSKRDEFFQQIHLRIYAFQDIRAIFLWLSFCSWVRFLGTIFTDFFYI